MKAILLGNGSREGVLEGVASLREEIKRAVEVVAVDFEGKADLSSVKADLAIVFGGDGSILRAVHQFNENQIPILAVNLGTLGFLSSVNPEELAPFLHSDAFKNFEVFEQIMLNCSVWRKRTGDPALDIPTPPRINKLHTYARPSNWRAEAIDYFCHGNYLVVNEVSARGGAPFSILKIELAVDGERVATFRGDGLVVATPVGSTGHSLSAGGPILRNELEAVVITPLSPQTMSFRPVIDSAARVYEMRVVSGAAFLVVDGDTRQQLTNGDLIAIRRLPFSFKMIRVPENKYYRNLQRKLGWAR
ncbi:MAG: NAD(+)/NADH kinase [Thermoguttaceae bacterium]|nr:NAD(+)/NADH kinase [Thermoguttaceae bacterium]